MCDFLHFQIILERHPSPSAISYGEIILLKLVLPSQTKINRTISFRPVYTSLYLCVCACAYVRVRVQTCVSLLLFRPDIFIHVYINLDQQPVHAFMLVASKTCQNLSSYSRFSVAVGVQSALGIIPVRSRESRLGKGPLCGGVARSVRCFDDKTKYGVWGFITEMCNTSFKTWNIYKISL